MTAEGLHRALLWRRNRNVCIRIAVLLVGWTWFSTLQAAAHRSDDEEAPTLVALTQPSLDFLQRELAGLEQLLSTPMDLHPRADETALLRERAALAELRFARSVARRRPELARQRRADLNRRYADTAALRIFDEE